MTEEIDPWNQGECILERESGAYLGMLLPQWAYDQLQEASQASQFEKIELIRKAIEHYAEHWIGPDVPANNMDAELDGEREYYRDLDTWIVEVLGSEFAEKPTATIGVHLEPDDIEDLYAVLDMENGETSIDFVRTAVQELIARRRRLQQHSAIESNPEAAS